MFNVVWDSQLNGYLRACLCRGNKKQESGKTFHCRNFGRCININLVYCMSQRGKQVSQDQKEDWMDNLLSYNRIDTAKLLTWSITFLGYIVTFYVVKYMCSKISQVLFICGCLMGAFWEVPLSISGWQANPSRLLRIFRPKYFLMLLPYCLWDGLLLMVAYWMEFNFSPAPHFVNFSWKVLALYVIWGQLSSFVVEVFAAIFGLWSYPVSNWNLLLLRLNDGPNGKITILPQLIWFVASLLFYFVCLYVHQIL
eukprot:TRINITY_DN2527_c0_g7_i1.p1 TRINITY_DN2527_c0_g7~~TRINITY_DN2527_c0_g7_i1.p1  ORF type:complete len:253 (+),score=-1.55 TRINITY_DN2527_c0_g7_i1:42-800(+)